MYALYLEYCDDNKLIPASEAMYRTIFNTEFNLSFFTPKKNLCDICHDYENSSQAEKENLSKEYDLHILNKNLARDLKNTDKQKAVEDTSDFCCAVFDLQQVLPVPKSFVGVSYYKLKLSTFNFTVFNLANKECYCYMWNEIIGKRGANEIGSALMMYVLEKTKDGIKTFLFYSDNCGSQNRNNFLYSLYNYLTVNYGVTIRHTYLERGHTQNEGDSAHSLIERASKNVPVYSPEQWYTLVRTGKRINPFKVIELSQENIFDLKSR